MDLPEAGDRGPRYAFSRRSRSTTSSHAVEAAVDSTSKWGIMPLMPMVADALARVGAQDLTVRVCREVFEALRISRFLGARLAAEAVAAQSAP